MVIESIRKVNHFEIDTDLFEKDGYEFIPMLFGQNLNKDIRYPESWQGTEQMTISPFIGINTLQELDKNVKTDTFSLLHLDMYLKTYMTCSIEKTIKST